MLIYICHFCNELVRHLAPLRSIGSRVRALMKSHLLFVCICRLERDWCMCVGAEVSTRGWSLGRGSREAKIAPSFSLLGRRRVACAAAWRPRRGSFPWRRLLEAARAHGDVMGVDMQRTPPASRGSRASGQSSRFAGDATPPRSSG